MKESPISITKSKRRPKPTHVYEIFQKQQQHNKKRVKKQIEKQKQKEREIKVEPEVEADKESQIEDFEDKANALQINSPSKLRKRRHSSFDEMDVPEVDREAMSPRIK